MEQEQMKLNQGQQKTFEKILHFFSDENTDTPVFILKGYAGTGKTTLLKEVVRALQKHPLHLMAPTGRATRVLEQISGCRATTIHKGIYTMKDPVIMKPT
jgi:tRNA A37 threonylcarbamoyladenosine biosynthesis protein TsaE